MIPNLFSRKPIPEKLPASMQAKIDILKKSKSKEECLRKAYDIMCARFEGYKWKTLAHPINLFRYKPEQSWNRPGFLHCTHMTYLLRILLVRSGFFKEEDLHFRFAFIHFISIHKYLKADISPGKTICVDVWGYYYYVPYGDYAHGFNCVHRRPSKHRK